MPILVELISTQRRDQTLFLLRQLRLNDLIEKINSTFSERLRTFFCDNLRGGGSGGHASPPPICELKKPIKIWFITLALGMNKIVNHPFPWCPGTSGSRTWSLSEL